MLLEPDRSPYDINFRLFGTPVRVHPLFWVVSAIFGWSSVERGIPYLLIWIACSFFSILLHEFGHIWAGKAFGSDGSIVLFSFGGLAIGASDLRLRWQRIVVYLAGPCIQLAVAAAIWIGIRNLTVGQLKNIPDLAGEIIDVLFLINLYWPLFNLLPIWPLDGGKITREICSALSREGMRISLGISIAVAGFIAVHALLAGHSEFRIPYLPTTTFAAIFFALLAYESYQLLQQSRFLHYEPPDDRLPWE